MAKTILVVDDSSSLRQVVSIALKGAGYDTIEACDGKDALGKIGGRKVHLIISDVNMPVMDGISFVKEVKKLPEHRFTPVWIIWTEHLFKMAFDRMVESAGSIVVPAIFLTQCTDHLDRAVRSKLLSDETKIGAREDTVDHPLQITADAVSRTTFRI